MFELPKEVNNDLESYRDSLEQFKKGKMPAARFKGIRVPWGIYSHRGGAVFMTRIRIPAGIVSPGQIKALAAASKKYGSGVLHITTRQDIQIHNVKIEDTIEVMDYLKSYNLSPRGGGGNTLRNVSACALAGVCKDEVFDVRQYALALTECLLSEEYSFNMPRKFKVGFSACLKDCAGCLVNDVGLFARYGRNGEKGFEVYAAGGLGADSRTGKLLEEFIPAEDAGYCVKALRNIFYKKGDRKNKHHNRLRFLAEDMGFDEFRRLYRKEFQEIKQGENAVLRKIDFPQPSGTGKIPQSEDRDYNEFLKYGVYPQKQDGFSIVGLRVPQGDITVDDLSGLAELENDFKGIEFRASQNQNLFICWVRNEDIYKLFLKIKGILGDFLYPDTLLDVVVCKGALTCNLGLCNSPGLAREIENVIKQEFIGSEVFRRLEIKLNGCPNSCGQQPLGKLSFYGMVKKVDNRPAPFYKFLIGGRKELKKTRLAKEAGILPAKNVPGFIREFLRRSEGIIRNKADIYDFLEKEAFDIAADILPDYSNVSAYSQNRDFYIDWEKTEEFSLAGLGAGECGSGVLDMIDSDLTESRIALEETEKEGYAAEKIKTSLFLSCRALLIVKGEEPGSEEEALLKFKSKFIEDGLASAEYSDIENIYADLNQGLGPDVRKEKFVYAKQFLEHINSIYKNMDSSFNFPRQKESVGPQEKETGLLDLKGTPCPINYVKAKLFLEGLNSGDIIAILLDEGEPIDNVPKSLENDGHRILKIEKQDGFYKIVVKKK